MSKIPNLDHVKSYFDKRIQEYDALADYLAAKGFDAHYYGYDFLKSAIETARQS